VGDGEIKRINTGQELRLAQAGLFEDKEDKKDKPADKKEEPKDKKDKPADKKAKGKGMSTAAKVLIGIATVGGIAALAGGGGGGGGGGGAPPPVSPNGG
jgi:hypothetical protein